MASLKSKMFVLSGIINLNNKNSSSISYFSELRHKCKLLLSKFKLEYSKLFG